MVAHLTPTPCCLMALAASMVIWSSVRRALDAQVVVFQVDVEIGQDQLLLDESQMIRVISSPSISTTGFFTLILDIAGRGAGTGGARLATGIEVDRLRDAPDGAARRGRVLLSRGQARQHGGQSARTCSRRMPLTDADVRTLHGVMRALAEKGPRRK
jgi:hypothetical protein